VTYGEDAAPIRSGKALQVMAALRNLALSLFRLAGATNLAAACRHYAAPPHFFIPAIQLTSTVSGRLVSVSTVVSSRNRRPSRATE
jgi:hypothetical protein